MSKPITEIEQMRKDIETHQKTLITFDEDIIQNKRKIETFEQKYRYLEDRYKESGGLKCLRDRGTIRDGLKNHLKGHLRIRKDHDLDYFYKDIEQEIEKLSGEKEEGIEVAMTKNVKEYSSLPPNSRPEEILPIQKDPFLEKMCIDPGIKDEKHPKIHSIHWWKFNEKHLPPSLKLVETEALEKWKKISEAVLLNEPDEVFNLPTFDRILEMDKEIEKLLGGN